MAHAFSNVKNTVESALETLTAAICEVAATPTAPIAAPETSMFSIAISTMSKDTDFSQNDMDDAFEIFMENPWVAETYAAITDASACTHFLHKRLDEFQTEKLDEN